MVRRRVGAGGQYVNINDADVLSPLLGPGRTEIWFMRPDHFRELIMGLDFTKESSRPDPLNLARTHVMLGRVKSESKDDIFGWLQRVNWSPNGEARTMITELGLHHTSMSVGDIMVIRGRVWCVQPMGFADLGRVDE